MTIPNLNMSDLNRAAELVSLAGSRAGLAALAIDTTDADPDTLKAKEVAEAASADANAALRLLLNMGAILPTSKRPAPMPSLSSLASLDTLAARDLLEALEAATRAAERLDRQRGDLDEEGNPDNWARQVGALGETLRLQLHGPERQAGRE